MEPERTVLRLWHVYQNHAKISKLRCIHTEFDICVAHALQQQVSAWLQPHALAPIPSPCCGMQKLVKQFFNDQVQLSQEICKKGKVQQHKFEPVV
jgi:hypothetical protein